MFLFCFQFFGFQFFNEKQKELKAFFLSTLSALGPVAEGPPRNGSTLLRNRKKAERKELKGMGAAARGREGKEEKQLKEGSGQARALACLRALGLAARLRDVRGVSRGAARCVYTVPLRGAAHLPVSKPLQPYRTLSPVPRRTLLKGCATSSFPYTPSFPPSG